MWDHHAAKAQSSKKVNTEQNRFAKGRKHGGSISVKPSMSDLPLFQVKVEGGGKVRKGAGGNRVAGGVWTDGHVGLSKNGLSETSRNPVLSRPAT